MKTGFVALVGLPNAGKSTLVNALVGEKVGIVSRKPQTTRRRVIGVFSNAESQIAFVDSPGRVKADAGLNAFLEKELEEVIADSDACLAVLNLDARKMTDLLEIVELVKNSAKPWFVVINKTDLDATHSQGAREVELRKLLHERFGDELKVKPIVSCSAVHHHDQLRERLIPLVQNLLPESEQPLFTDDVYTTQTSRELVSEIVREKCFEYLHQEVPYGLAVKVIKYDESGKIPKIYVEIIVSKENFVSMVVGRNGQMIKRIGASSRIDCEKALGQKIYLETHVKVKRDWFKNPEMMKELGYVTAN
jgi:GTP-binding protein Era